MNRIKDWLYVGNYQDSINLSQLNKAGVRVVLQLAQRLPKSDLRHLYLPLEDGQYIPTPKLEEALDFLATQRADGEKVLIACGAGVSRAAVISMAALHEFEGMGFLEAYSLLRQERPIIAPHPILIRSLCLYYADAPPFEELWQAMGKLDG